MAAIREHGLRLITPGGTHILPMMAVTEPSQIDFGPEDVVFLCVKGQDTEKALRTLRAQIEDIPVFCFQNGVRNEEVASRYFPRVYGVAVSVGSVFINDGEVIARYDPPGFHIMGVYPRGTDDLVNTVATDLRDAGFLVGVTPDIMPYKWGKLLLNLNNAVGAITNVRGNGNERITRAARQEAESVLAKAGIHWASVLSKDLVEPWPEIVGQPRKVLKVEAQSSTWQSLVRQRGTVEADLLNGEIVRVAERLGFRAPINEKLLNIVKEMAASRELPGKYTPAELCRQVGLEPVMPPAK